MQFLSPVMLLTLGLIPLLILIHALKPRPKELDVTNLFLWQEVFREHRSRLTLDRLRKNLPLLLQILVVVLLALALTRPVWQYLTRNTGNILLVIDTSASMQTRTAAGTRFEQARQQALEVIDQADPHQEILIVDAGHTPSIASGFVADRAKAKELVNALTPSDAPGRLEQAVYLALSFVNPAQEDVIYLLTDGAGQQLSDVLQTHHNLVPILMSGGERNVGITKFEFRQRLDQPDQYE
ncbi:VWA domain-containing protein, partial [candidate division KSB3 bacterium]|nr:VWA domain-containing protein [candidate division KSB3 bacterium]MBD3324275.1 VWA domain-containing protein [candidate division KSB3 bacterium]